LYMSVPSGHFLFQAEDGIRDFHVTGVQTCALPILPPLTSRHTSVENWMLSRRSSIDQLRLVSNRRPSSVSATMSSNVIPGFGSKIGRASCRERVEIWEVDGSRKKEVKREKADAQKR